MAHDVFLSHSHQDKVFADAICHSLEAHGIRCWVAPRDIRPSEDWAEAIINALDTARVLVLVFSSNSNSSPQVRREVERAVNKGLHILPLRIENVPLSKSLEYFISTQHWLDAIEGKLDFHLGQLRDCLTVLLERPVMADKMVAVATALPSTPAPAATFSRKPAGLTIDSTALARIEANLAQLIGPIARLLVQRMAPTAASPAELIARLASEIDDAVERKTFIERCHAGHN
ncbi:toll/interleukin-1 receptor domain-containing protein [Massilia jejuensis]|uniref:Toll/interleukin-1 receptor domain-containing protein n=1 Tax=Massilia jejuensis TaxID=648894 RepID=A0ABW0PK60_9BURK